MGDIASLAKALKAKRAGDGYVCRCPAHEDKHASLSLSEGDGGRLLWHCHAGCSQDAVRDALTRLGLLEAPAERRQARARSAGPQTRTKPTGRHFETIEGGKDKPAADPAKLTISATYDYVDVTGTLLFQVIRFEPKTFRQRRPKGSGWEWGLGRVQPIPYRLPEVAAAITVFVGEGEKDVENLRKLGLTATSSPMGAGKWRPEYGQYLTGKHVLILPDNDGPGREHALDVASSAHEHGARSIRIVELPGLPEKGDVSDWLAAGGTREELERLCRAAPIWKPDTKGGDAAWQKKLLEGEYGPKANEANVKIALELAPDLAGRLRFDAFLNRREAHDLPWDPQPDWRPWSDDDTTELAIWCQHYEIDIRPTRCDPVVWTVARKVQLHGPRDYLLSLKWDGVPRVEDWLRMYLGCSYTGRPEVELYLKAIGKRWLIACVARVMEPGCKVDTAIIFEGKQGTGKSSALRALFGNDWFTDEIAELGSKDAAQDLAGKWCIELSELDAFTRAEIERVKAFISRQVDHYRPSYARSTADFPRQCVFAGSTNKDEYLQDETGGRRFWPCVTGQVQVQLLLEDRDQLWAEAVSLYLNGEKWWLTREEEALAREQQGLRLEPEAWGGVIDAWIRKNAFLTSITVDQVLLEACGLGKEKWEQKYARRVGKHLKASGWRRVQDWNGGDRQWVYKRELG